MKLIYQQMIAFFTIIIMCAAIIGYSVLTFTRDQAYEMTFERLEGYSESMGEIVMNQPPSADGSRTLDVKFLDELQMVMRQDAVTLRVFNASDEQIYPNADQMYQIPDNIWKLLKQGKTVRVKNDHEDKNIKGKSKEAYSWVITPWIQDEKIVGVVLLGAKVTNIEEPVISAKNNLITAFLITMIVGLILSYILAHFTINRIKKLSRATKRVATGDFDVQIKHTDKDELDELAGDFNSMVQSLKKSNEEISLQEDRRNQFLADAAHEMRTPLTTINGILEGLQYDAIPEESKEQSIELMRNETNRLIRLVNENLDYEKIRNNQILLYKSEFDAVPLVRNILTQLEQKAKENNDNLTLTGDSAAQTYADHDRFTQVIFNLVQNALQFTQDGQITVAVKRLEHSTRVSVSDTGIGMDEQQTHFIFDRFYKADQSRKKMGTGESGLGLAIVSSLIKQHGGLIQVESTPGVGTIFTVEFFDDGFQHYQEASN